MTRTNEQWLASDFWRVASVANLEMKRLYSLAQKTGIDMSPEGYVSGLFDAHADIIENARKAWCAGDDRAAAEFVAWVAICVGFAAHDPDYKASIRAKANGEKSRGVPRPNRRHPVLRALRVLIDEGLTNAEILAALGDADGISERARSGFPIEVCEPETTLEEDGYLRWYLPGGDSDSPEQYPVKTIKNRLPVIRKSRKQLR